MPPRKSIGHMIMFMIIRTCQDLFFRAFVSILFKCDNCDMFMDQLNVGLEVALFTYLGMDGRGRNVIIVTCS